MLMLSSDTFCAEFIFPYALAIVFSLSAFPCEISPSIIMLSTASSAEKPKFISKDVASASCGISNGVVAPISASFLTVSPALSAEPVMTVKDVV